MIDDVNYDSSAAWAFAIFMCMILIIIILLYVGNTSAPADSEPVPEVVVDTTEDCMVNFQKKFAVELTKGEPLKRELTENEIKTLHSVAMYECKLRESK